MDRRNRASKTSALNMRRLGFRILMQLVRPVRNVFAGLEVYQCGSLFKHHLLMAQEQILPDVASQAGKAKGLLG